MHCRLSAQRLAAARALRRKATQRRGLSTQLADAFAHADSEPLWYRLGAGVNDSYKPDRLEPMKLTRVRDNHVDLGSISPDHAAPIGEWSEERLRLAAAKHCIGTWGPSAAVAALPMITHGEGVYLYDSHGTKYLDWTSQAVCTNIGHTLPPAVKAAINAQLDAVPMVYSGLGLLEVRVRLSQLLAELCPGDLNAFLFTCGGGEANEAAMRIAKRYTGKNKIINQYRSYHGGSTAALSATGDFRRWFGEVGTSGYVKSFNPQPFSFSWGENDEERSRMLLLMLEEQIRMEGPETIAAVMIETIVGAGGVLVPPQGYIEGVRAICDHHNLLLVMDEVMVGLGRTGKMWAVQHFDGVIPDILTSAKGMTGGILPLGMVGMTDKIKDFFNKEPLGWGATYANHPVGMACAYEVLKFLVENDLPAKAAALEPVMVEQMEKLVAAHPSVRQARCVGLMGAFDLVDPATGRFVQAYQQQPPPRVAAFKKAMLEHGLYGLFRPPLLHCAPPLTITEPQLRDGFDRLDKALQVLDDGCPFVR